MQNRQNRLELIIGCMFSGKTSSLIAKHEQHRLLGRNVLVITHSMDTRYGEKLVSTHDGKRIDAHATDTLLPLMQSEAYAAADTVFVEEAQFFDDLVEFVHRAVEADGKHVVVCGLDGDFQRRPFANILALVPFAESVEKRSALCGVCKDGTPACFSKRLSRSTERNLVGGIAQYIPVCRRHFHTGI